MYVRAIFDHLCILLVHVLNIWKVLWMVHLLIIIVLLLQPWYLPCRCLTVIKVLKHLIIQIPCLNRYIQLDRITLFMNCLLQISPVFMLLFAVFIIFMLETAGSQLFSWLALVNTSSYIHLSNVYVNHILRFINVAVPNSFVVYCIRWTISMSFRMPFLAKFLLYFFFAIRCENLVWREILTVISQHFVADKMLNPIHISMIMLMLHCVVFMLFIRVLSFWWGSFFIIIR